MIDGQIFTVAVIVLLGVAILFCTFAYHTGKSAGYKEGWNDCEEPMPPCGDKIEHNYWRKKYPNPWRCPSCAAIRAVQRRAQEIPQ